MVVLWRQRLWRGSTLEDVLDGFAESGCGIAPQKNLKKSENSFRFGDAAAREAVLRTPASAASGQRHGWMWCGIRFCLQQGKKRGKACRPLFADNQGKTRRGGFLKAYKPAKRSLTKPQSDRNEEPCPTNVLFCMRHLKRHFLARRYAPGMYSLFPLPNY